jgi:hypothetical protein
MFIQRTQHDSSTPYEAAQNSFWKFKGPGPLKEFKMYLAHGYHIRNAKITFCCHAQQIFDKEMSHQN